MLGHGRRVSRSASDPYKNGLALFGWAATGRPATGSDVDVLHVLRDGVHLVTKRALHDRLRDAVLAEPQVVYAASAPAASLAVES